MFISRERKRKSAKVSGNCSFLASFLNGASQIFNTTELCKAYRVLRTEESRAKILRELPKSFWERPCIAGDEKPPIIDIYMQFTPKDRRDLQRREADSFADEIKQQVQGSECNTVTISSS